MFILQGCCFIHYLLAWQLQLLLLCHCFRWNEHKCKESSESDRRIGPFLIAHVAHWKICWQSDTSPDPSLRLTSIVELSGIHLYRLLTHYACGRTGYWVILAPFDWVVYRSTAPITFNQGQNPRQNGERKTRVLIHGFVWLRFEHSHIGADIELVGWDRAQWQSLSQVGLGWNDKIDFDRRLVVLFGIEIVLQSLFLKLLSFDISYSTTSAGWVPGFIDFGASLSTCTPCVMCVCVPYSYMCSARLSLSQKSSTPLTKHMIPKSFPCFR